MRRRIAVAIAVVTAVAVALFGIPLAVVIRDLYLVEARTRLEREATLASRDVPSDLSAAGSVVLPRLTSGAVLGLYGGDGRKMSGAGPGTGDLAVREATANRISNHEVNDRLVAAVPVVVNERVVAVVRAETSTHAAEHRAHLAWVFMAALGSLVVGFATSLAIVQANRLTRPLRRVRDDAARLGHGDFSIVVPHGGVAELDDVADALTSTAQRLGLAMQREQAFSANASHQLRTPITGLRLAIESELAAPRADAALALDECLALTDRLEATVTDLLRLSRAPARTERLDVMALVDHARTLWQRVLDAGGRTLALPAEVLSTTVMASNAAIGQALDVLIDNAVRHGRGAVTVTCDEVAGGVALTVTDEGSGGATGGGGHGIGLELATALVETEGGRLRLPKPGGPSVYSIVLPVVQPAGPSRAQGIEPVGKRPIS